MKLKSRRSFIIFIAADVVLALVLVLVLWPGADLTGTRRIGQPGAAPSTGSPLGTTPAPGVASNLMPINNVDPMTGEPVRLGCPTVQYKGQTIGFCCKQSPAFNGGWNRMSESAKDAFVARFTR